MRRATHATAGMQRSQAPVNSTRGPTHSQVSSGMTAKFMPYRPVRNWAGMNTVVTTVKMYRTCAAAVGRAGCAGWVNTAERRAAQGHRTHLVHLIRLDLLVQVLQHRGGCLRGKASGHTLHSAGGHATAALRFRGTTRPRTFSSSVACVVVVTSSYSSRNKIWSAECATRRVRHAQGSACGHVRRLTTPT